MNISDINNISLGGLSVRSITLGNLPIWDDGGIEITISPSSVSVSSGYTAFTITVDSSDDTWDVYSPLSWVGSSKLNDTSARVTVSTNQYATARTGYVYFQVDDRTYATLTIDQAASPHDPFPSAWDIEAEDGDWAFATMQYDSEKTLVAVIYRYQNTAPPTSIEYTLDCDYDWDDEGSIETDNIYEEYTIDPTETITVNGQNYYGCFVDGPYSFRAENQTMYYIKDLEEITGVNFSVSAA